MNYYIADTHFGHANIIKLSNRPFTSVEEMDGTIIKNWNSRVTNSDDVYILGDFAYKGEEPVKYLKQLNGHKHLILGNHDGKIRKAQHIYSRYFDEIVDLRTVNDNGTQIVCFHYPMVEWNGYYRDTLHFYGHLHNTVHNETTQYAMKMKNAYNVGADILGYTPRTLEEIIAIK